jgi:hypothetical protein
MAMSIDLIRNYVLNIVDKYPIKKIILFGSRADETNKDDSDVDLILEFTTPISLIMLSQIKCDLEEILGLPVDVIHGPIRSDDMIEIGKVVELYAA